jgi:hypothetical protein
LTIPEPASCSGKKPLDVSVYTPENKKAWNDFVSASKNGVFIFNRDYMECQSSRFKDHSLMFYDAGQLVAVLPANEEKDVLFSHGGLTFGGVVSGFDMSEQLMLEIFEKLKAHCAACGFSKLFYKAAPQIYHSIPAEEDLYALYFFGAKLVGRNVSSTIFLPRKRAFDDKRRDAITAAKISLQVRQSFDFLSFMKMVEETNSEHPDAKPVYSPEEMDLLAKKFPENIKLFSAYHQQDMAAGCLIYESKNVAYGQYAANSKSNRTLAAQDVIVDYLVNEYYVGKKYFDFGVSTLDMGRVRDEGLLAHKEGFRASSIMYDFYELPIAMQ